METQEQKDNELWRLAKKRVHFKRHLGTYLVINAMFWMLWLLTDKHHHGIPWPVWPALGWGIGLAFNYMDAYVDKSSRSVQKEYDKLKNQ